MNFGIGTTALNITDLASLATPVEYPRSTYLPVATAKRTGANTVRGLGLPVAIWEFQLITLAERNKLKTYCTGQSATVFISTKKDDDTYDEFECTLIWPVDDTSKRWYGERRDLVLEFVNLVAT